ncbi:lytic transglycosylase domain-containing protein [Luteimonas sp. A534]
MLPGMELMGCADLAVPAEVMQHVVRIESSSNPYAIGVVGGRLVRQPRSLPEAVATARMLEGKGYNFSVGLAQVNRHNLATYGLSDYARAFQACPNLEAGSRILADCHTRAGGDWGKAFSCYYSGNFVTGFRHGYVQKVMASLAGAVQAGAAAIGIEGIERPEALDWARRTDGPARDLMERRTLPESAIPQATERPEPVAATAPSPARALAPAASAEGPVVVQFTGARAAAPSAPRADTSVQDTNTSTGAHGVRRSAPEAARGGRDEAFVF